MRTATGSLNRVPGVRQRRMSPRRRLVIASVGLLGTVIGLFTYGVGAFDGLEETTIDTRFAIRGDQVPPDELIVVGIDDDTFSDLELQFPFPRSLHAKVVDGLVADGAAVIAYDVQFTEPTSRREDNALVRAVWSAPAITLATTEVTRRGEHRVLGGEGTLEQGRDARVGDAQIELSDGGVLRELPPNDTGLDLFPIVVAEQRGAAPIAESSFPDDRWIDFFGPPGTIASVSFSDVAKGDFEPGTFEGKTVFVGAMASSLQDSHKVPTADNEMFGVEYQATATATIEAGFPLRSAGELASVLVIIALAMLPAALFLRLDALLAFSIAVVAAGLYLVAGQLAFNGGAILPVVYPLLGLTISAVGGIGTAYVFEAFDRQRARDRFARFASDAVVDQVLEDKDESMLKGLRAEVTVLFSDIRGFTTFSETRPPEEVFETLNQYLTEMADAILEEGGTIVSFMGDGIIAVFGAPIESSDHADRAIAAARKMLGGRIEAFNRHMEAQGAEPFDMGIGIHSGPVMSGMVGSERRFDYTVIGDTANTAARLEGMTKGTPHQLFVSESTKVRVVDSETMAQLVNVGELEVRGRAGTITVWTLPETDKGVGGPERSP